MVQNRTKRKNGQIKIQQMAFMLIAVFIFFMLAGLFYFAIQYREVKKSAGSLEQEKATLNALIIAGMPEFSCGINCIDEDRLLFLNSKNYVGLLPFSSLEIRRIFPVPESKGKDIECSIQSYPNCNVFTIVAKNVSSQREISAFVSICRKEIVGGYVYNKCEVGKVIVGYELK